MAKSPIPSVRALNEIRDLLKPRCEKIEGEKYDELTRKIGSIKSKLDVEVSEEVADAIRELDIPYVLQAKNVCSIRQYNGDLAFTLKFEPHNYTETASLIRQRDAIDERRKKLVASLHKWHEESLYLVASRKPVNVFKHKDLPVPVTRFG
jgi:hypothetical protein